MLFAAVAVAAAQTTCTDDPSGPSATDTPTSTVTIPAISVTSATVTIPATTSVVTSGTATVVVPPEGSGTASGGPSGSGTYVSRV